MYNTKKIALKRWLYYASLKNEVHSKSYKLPEHVLKTLKEELSDCYISITK